LAGAWWQRSNVSVAAASNDDEAQCSRTLKQAGSLPKPLSHQGFGLLVMSGLEYWATDAEQDRFPRPASEIMIQSLSASAKIFACRHKSGRMSER